MKKKIKRDAEDLCFVAERQYQRMIDHVSGGIIDKDEIIAAMGFLNNAHMAAIMDDKRYLIE